MLTLRRHKGGDLDVMLVCDGACGRPLRITDAWLAWPINGPSEPKWLHRTCANGAYTRVCRSDRVLLWRATDALGKLLRQTEEEGCDLIPVRGLKSGKPS
jgi:hypothetical protein